MIATIQGQITSVLEDHLILEVNGIGYRVYVPQPLPTEVHRSDQISLYTHLVVREDSLTLYGFPEREQVDIFNLLMGVNGVGPRLALEVLSTHPPQTIRRAVLNEQSELFQQVSGIGKKTAQKIILYLEDRISIREELEEFAPGSEINTEVQEALVALGYSVVEAQTALQTIPADAPEDVEIRLRIALQNIR
jgi:Holliday junction DNA helicase RuvA